MSYVSQWAPRVALFMCRISCVLRYLLYATSGERIGCYTKKLWHKIIVATHTIHATHFILVYMLEMKQIMNHENFTRRGCQYLSSNKMVYVKKSIRSFIEDFYRHRTSLMLLFNQRDFININFHFFLLIGKF